LDFFFIFTFKNAGTDSSSFFSILFVKILEQIYLAFF
jgi:hypothetical protein